MTTEIDVIRHGETDWNVEGRIQGWVESELNERGKLQAAALGARYGAERQALSAKTSPGSRGDLSPSCGRGVVAIYSSDLKRTMDTANSIGRVLGLDVIGDERLREWHLGVMEGMLIGEAREKVPEAMRIYDERIVDKVVPGGESIRARYGRAIGCLKEIEERHRGERVVVVTHGGILDDVYRFVEGVGLECACEWELYNCGVNRLKIVQCKLQNEHLGGGDRTGEQRWGIVTWGDVGHLEGIGAMANWGGDTGNA